MHNADGAVESKFLTKLEHMQIPVKDLDESIDWYVANLGFELAGKSNEHHHAFLTLQEGPMLMLWETAEDTSANFAFRGQTMPVLLYSTRRIRELHDRLTALGAAIPFYRDEGFGWVLKFIDPSGNMWGVIQMHADA